MFPVCHERVELTGSIIVLVVFSSGFVCSWWYEGVDDGQDDFISKYFLVFCVLLFRNNTIFDKKKIDDPSQLISTFEATDLVGIVSLLYGMMLYSGAPSRSDVAPPELSAQTLAIIISGLRMLNHMALLDLNMLQVRPQSQCVCVRTCVSAFGSKRLLVRIHQV